MISLDELTPLATNENLILRGFSLKHGHVSSMFLNA